MTIMANVKAGFFSAFLMIFLAISTTDVQGKSLSLRIVNVTGESPCQSGLIHEEDAFVVTGRVTTENINASDSQRVQFTIVGTNFEATVCTVRLSSCHEQDSSSMGCYCQNTGDGEYDVVLRQKANVQYSTAKVKLEYKDDDFSFEMSSTSWRIPETFHKDTEKLTLKANGIEVDLTSSQCTLPLREGQNTFMYCCSDAPSCDVRITEPDGRESGSTECYKLTAYGIDESLNYAFSYSVCGVESSQSYTCKGKFAPELFPTSPPPPSLEEDDEEESDKSGELGIIVGVSAAAAVVLLVIVIVLGLRCYRKKQSHGNTEVQHKKPSKIQKDPPSYADAIQDQSYYANIDETARTLPHDVLSYDDPVKNASVLQASTKNKVIPTPPSAQRSYPDEHSFRRDDKNSAKAEKDESVVNDKSNSIQKQSRHKPKDQPTKQEVNNVKEQNTNVSLRPLPPSCTNGCPAANGSVSQSGRLLPKRSDNSGPNLGKGFGARSFEANQLKRQERTSTQSGDTTGEGTQPKSSPPYDNSQSHGTNQKPSGSCKPPTSHTFGNFQEANLQPQTKIGRAVHADNCDQGCGESGNSSSIDNNRDRINAYNDHNTLSGNYQSKVGSSDNNGTDSDKENENACNGQASSGAFPQPETNADNDQRKVSSSNIKNKDSSNANNGQSSANDKDEGKVENIGKGSSGTDQQTEPNTDRPLHGGNSDPGSEDSGDGSGIGKDKDRTSAYYGQSSDSDNCQGKVEDSGKSGSGSESQSETSDNAIDQENVSSMNASGSDTDGSNANNGESSVSVKVENKTENNGKGSSSTDKQPELNTDRPLHGGDSDQDSGDSGDGSGINKNTDKDRTSACNGQSSDSDNGQGKVGDIGKSGSGTEPQSETSTDESGQKPETKTDRLDHVDDTNDSDQGSVGSGDSSGIDRDDGNANSGQSSVSDNNQVEVDNSGKGDSSPDQQSETKIDRPDQVKVDNNGKGGSGTDQQPETKIDRPDHVDGSDQGSGRSGDSSSIDKDKDNGNGNANKAQSSISGNAQVKVDNNGKVGSGAYPQSETGAYNNDQKNVSIINVIGKRTEKDKSNANSGQSSVSDKGNGKVETKDKDNGNANSGQSSVSDKANSKVEIKDNGNANSGQSSVSDKSNGKVETKDNDNANSGQSSVSDNNHVKEDNSGKGSSGTDSQSETGTDKFHQENVSSRKVSVSDKDKSHENNHDDIAIDKDQAKVGNSDKGSGSELKNVKKDDKKYSDENMTSVDPKRKDGDSKPKGGSLENLNGDGKEVGGNKDLCADTKF